MSRILTLSTALITLAAVLGAPSAQAKESEVPGDQPLPGYVIQNPPLAPIIIDGQPTVVRQGVHEHAAYNMEVPPAWNGDLVMWAHGFRGQGFVLFAETPAFGLRQRLLTQGYAWASSSYYDNGYDIRAGVLSTRSLAELFKDTQGRPHRTYIAGVSMGGHIVGRSLEQFPGFYAGGLPMCGVMGDQTLFDFFLDYQLVAQALSGVDAYPVPSDYLQTKVPQIQATLGIASITPLSPEPANDLGRQLRAITINRSGGPRPGAEAAFAAWKDFLFSIAVPTGAGNTPAQRPSQVATNVGTIYQPNTPVDINRVVRRVPVENVKLRVLPTLTQVPHIAGRPTDPVVSLHGLGDLFVTFSMEQAYARDVARHDKSRNLVQRAIRTTNHCEFSPVEAGTAWDDLAAWVRTGQRPAGDNVLSPSDPTFGCAFSDKAAYNAGSGTRRLYAACP
ncbi:MAG TPA: hypothetical protein VFC19_32330 [Candidatus Limnocylindrales bacterium]|nr:hypothetical protein [Candidatus Limnocylindrales bacterium]